MVVKNQEGYFGCRGPPEELDVPALHQAHKPSVVVYGGEMPTTSGCGNVKIVVKMDDGVAGAPRIGFLHGLAANKLLPLSSSAGTAT